LLDTGKSVKDIAIVLKDQGVPWSDAWDVAPPTRRRPSSASCLRLTRPRIPTFTVRTMSTTWRALERAG